MKATVALVVLVLVAVYGQNCATDGCNAEWDGPCCSQYGYCGKTEDYCKRDKGCVNGCWDDPAPPPPAPTTKAPEPTHNDGGSLGYIHTADRPGMDLPNQPVTASNEKECQVLCYNNKECVTWAFDSCGTNCWLKNGKPGEVKADCRRSGFISAKRDGTRPTPTPTSAPVPTRNNNNNTGACFPMGSASFKNGNPNNLNQWWCPADQIYGFLGFSYPMEDGNCWGDSNSYATISRDMANMKKKFGAKYLRVYLPECRDTILYKNLVKAGRDNDMAVIPMIFWDWQQNDGKMNAAQNALLGVFKDSEVGAIAPYVIHSVAFGDELGEQGDYWYPKMLSFKAQLAQHGVPITMTDDWDRGIFKQGNSLNDFGKKVNAASNLTNVHIMPYYHPDQCPDAYHFWPYFQSQIDFITRNNMKRPIMVSQTCWNSDRNGGHGRGSHDDARNLDNYKKYWTTFTDNCEYFKQNKVGWFVHAYSDSGEPGFGMLDWNGNPKFDFKPNRC